MEKGYDLKKILKIFILGWIGLNPAKGIALSAQEVPVLRSFGNAITLTGLVLKENNDWIFKLDKPALVPWPSIFRRAQNAKLRIERTNLKSDVYEINDKWLNQHLAFKCQLSIERTATAVSGVVCDLKELVGESSLKKMFAGLTTYPFNETITLSGVLSSKTFSSWRPTNGPATAAHEEKVRVLYLDEPINVAAKEPHGPAYGVTKVQFDSSIYFPTDRFMDKHVWVSGKLSTADEWSQFLPVLLDVKDQNEISLTKKAKNWWWPF